MRIDDVEDLELSSADWHGPGASPLFVIATDTGSDERARAAEPVRTPIPRGVRPAAGDRWLDVGAGYGAFSIYAARLGAAAVVPVESDPALRELCRKTLYLEDDDRIAEPRALSSTRELETLIADQALDAVRLGSGAPWISLPPAVRKVVERTERRRLRITRDRLELSFRYVVIPTSYGRPLAPVHVFAWDRR